LAISFKPGAAPAAAVEFDSSGLVRKSGAVAGRSKGLRLEAGAASGEVTASDATDSSEVAAAAWALTLV